MPVKNMHAVTNQQVGRSVTSRPQPKLQRAPPPFEGPYGDLLGAHIASTHNKTSASCLVGSDRIHDKAMGQGSVSLPDRQYSPVQPACSNVPEPCLRLWATQFQT